MVNSAGRVKFLRHQWDRSPLTPEFEPGSIFGAWLKSDPALIDHLIEIERSAEQSARRTRAYLTALRDNTIGQCTSCGAEFIATRSDAEFCSPACRQKAYRRRNAS